MLRPKRFDISGKARIWQTVRSLATKASPTKQEVELQSLDKKWAQIWKTYYGSLNPGKTLNPNVEKFYCCSMFPYPSGMLHMGHLRVYTISDVVARYMRLKGRNVIHPMGWDAFGLPAENAAIENGIDPAIWTKENISKMKVQMDMMLADFDWDREISTCDPEYYKWTQKIFLLLVEHGMAYRKKAQINWDPVDQTVLANEQVDSEGKSWRSGALVEKRDLDQWFIGITKYAKELAEDCLVLEHWPEKVKVMQKNWIGESHGATITFPTISGDKLTVFTTRPDTLFSVQFLAVSRLHPIVQAAAMNDPELQDFLSQHKEAAAESKAGYKIKNTYASIPISVDGEKQEVYNVPVYVATYVIDSYGSGAVMGCPGHDERDFEFWGLHNPLVRPVTILGPKDLSKFEVPFTLGNGRIYDSSLLSGSIDNLGFVNGLSSSQASKKITEKLTTVGMGKNTVQYRIRDWLISRQRYWGAPIPMIHCDDCGIVPVPDSELPVMLPERDENSRADPLAKLEEFVHTKCPSCGGDAKRETDTMDTFMDSSWYFFRYLDSKNTEQIFSPDKVSQFMPMDIYFGGVEHAILHLLYTRFMSKFLGDIGYWSGKEVRYEPIRRLITQGMVQGKTFTDPQTGRFLKPNELDLDDPNKPLIAATGVSPSISYQKMSKSKFNGADPEACIKKYGADATRAHMLFLGPISDPVNWNEEQIQGCERWLKRVVSMADSVKALSNIVPADSNIPKRTVEKVEINGKFYDQYEMSEKDVELFNTTQLYIGKVSAAIETDFTFNTLVSDLMKFSNTLTASLKAGTAIRTELISDSFKKFLVLLSPIAPSVAEEAWHILHDSDVTKVSVFHSKIPEAQHVTRQDINYNIFVNGRVRGHLKESVSFVNSSEDEILDKVRSLDGVSDLLKSKTPKKLIVKNGVISIVL